MKKNGTGNGPIMRPEPNSPLLGSGQSRQTMMASIGQRLRELYVAEPSDAMPDHLRGLLQRLAAVGER
jgi:hypothetical protein